MKCLLIIFAIFFFYLFIYYPSPINASLNTCSATLSPNAVQPSTSSSFILNITNSDSKDIQWIKITKPFTSLTTTNVSVSGWNPDYTPSGNDITLTGNLLLPSYNLGVNINIDVGDINGSSGNWTVQASD